MGWMASILTDCSRIVQVKSLKQRVRVKETGFLAASGVASQRFNKETRFLSRGDGVKLKCYPLPGARLWMNEEG